MHTPEGYSYVVEHPAVGADESDEEDEEEEEADEEDEKKKDEPLPVPEHDELQEEEEKDPSIIKVIVVEKSVARHEEYLKSIIEEMKTMKEEMARRDSEVKEEYKQMSEKIISLSEKILSLSAENEKLKEAMVAMFENAHRAQKEDHQEILQKIKPAEQAKARGWLW